MGDAGSGGALCHGAINGARCQVLGVRRTSMAINPIVTDRVITLLNELLAADREATRRIINTRYPCTKALCAHKDVHTHNDGGKDTVSILGIFNALCGTYETGIGKGRGPITIAFDHDGEISKFRRLDD